MNWLTDEFAKQWWDTPLLPYVSWIPYMGVTMVDADFSPLDLDMPLNATTPPTWAIKERRVEWVLHNFTDGELAYVYKVLHDGRGMRRSGVDEVMKKEKTA